MAGLAVILHDGAPREREMRLERILSFFGVPSRSRSVAELAAAASPEGEPAEIAVFGSLEALAAALAAPSDNEWLGKVSALYAYSSGASESAEALKVMGLSGWSLATAPSGVASLRVSGDHRELTGAMSGLDASASLAPDDSVLARAGVGPAAEIESIITANGAPVLVRFRRNGVPAFVCTSSRMVDIDEPVARNYYDVKDHFCAAVPLVMFLRWAFSDVMWQPRELGACLIIDDPLLKRQYGFCNFPSIRELMKRHRFTTNVAFIPWNWRRTTISGSRLFREERGLFSVSIHGCDHTASEFGATSIETLDRQAKLAQARMQGHQRRTTIEHDPVMVFPQGVFSSQCPGVLKRNGFVAAVNTEVAPVDGENGRTAVRDVWDVAMMRYGSFPIYTRRYAFHGLENFAFDLLLGKPCFIVAHHEFFADGGSRLVDLVEKLSLLNCRLEWRSPREVIRRAYRRRAVGAGDEQVEMYANELVIANVDEGRMRVEIRKREIAPALLADIRADGRSLSWQTADNYLSFCEDIPRREDRLFEVVYKPQQRSSGRRHSIGYEVSVAARRILCEFRDQYLHKVRLRRTRSRAQRMRSQAV